MRSNSTVMGSLAGITLNPKADDKYFLFCRPIDVKSDVSIISGAICIIDNYHFQHACWTKETKLDKSARFFN